jgi:hypothetical protein
MISILIRIVFFYCDRFNKFLSEKSLINVAKSITYIYNFNEVIGLFDFGLTRDQFLNRLRLIL